MGSVEEIPSSSTEIFIRNLPFDATIQDLEELCGTIGPVKRASIIQNDGVSRGFGFVKFAIAEDARRAATNLNHSTVKGRHVFVELAMKKGQRPAGIGASSSSGDKNSSSKGGRRIQGKEKDSLQQDHLSVQYAPSAAPITRTKRKAKVVISQEKPRTLLAFNLADETTEKQLFKRVKKIELPKRIKIEKIDGSRVAVLIFESASAALKVQNKLDQHVLHGKMLSLRPVVYENVNAHGSAPETEPTDQSPAGVSKGRYGARSISVDSLKGQAKRTGRVIVRNLSFKATQKDLKDALSIYGPVLEAVVPKVEINGGTQGQRGFGFVTFASAEDAERAVKNDRKLTIKGREVAVDSCLGRREYQKQVATTSAEAETETKAEQEEEVSHDNAEDESSSNQSENAADDDDDEEEEQEEEEEEEEDINNDDHEQGESESEIGAEKDDQENQNKSQAKSDVGEGKTVFVRNVPFDATPETLKAAFGVFGPVAFGALVKDRSTGMSKGTAFVKFKSVKGVEAVLDATDKAGGLLDLMGRQLKVNKAVERSQAPQPIVKGDTNSVGDKKGTPKTDRRNLYLANEGLVLNSEEQEVPKSDLDKRQREQAEKKQKLRNPLFFVSATRLSVRNLARSVTDKELTSVLREAVRKGLIAGKVTIEDINLQRQAQGLVGTAETEDLRVPSKLGDVVVKVKVMRDLEKKPVDGVYPSRGYAFADFSSHAHALAALRHVNNNPSYTSLALGGVGRQSGSKHRLIISFAVENHKALLKKEQREIHGAVKSEDTALQTDRPKKEQVSRGRRQREQRKKIRAAKGDAPKNNVDTKDKTGKDQPRAPKGVSQVPTRLPRPTFDNNKRLRGQTGSNGYAEEILLRATDNDDDDDDETGTRKKKRRKPGAKAYSEEESRFLASVKSHKNMLMNKLGIADKNIVSKGSKDRWFDKL